MRWTSILSSVVPFFLATAPQTAQDLTERFRQVYRDLESPGPVSRLATTTLRFSYVSPPNGTTSTWRSSANLTEDVRPGARGKPTAVIIPGLDGYGISAVQQYDDLANAFDFWRLHIDPSDRSSFSEIVSGIAGFIEELEGPVTLIGESCGGLIAPAVALKLQKKGYNNLAGLVLVNPATSFDTTAWDSIVPALTGVLKNIDTDPEAALTPYSILASAFFSALIPDGDQVRRIGETILGLPSLKLPPSVDTLMDIMQGTTRMFRGVEERLPADLLEHRVTEWLDVGTAIINPRLGDLDLPVLVVAGQEDNLMPSANEAKRLEKTLARCETLVVRGRGHFVLDQNVNLTEAIVYSNIDPLGRKSKLRKYNPVKDWKRPSPEKIKEVGEKTVDPLRRFHSPVFFTSDAEGKRWKGLSKLPRTERPILIVGNHQFGALDLGLVVGELVQKTHLHPRGLTHPIQFQMMPVNELYGRKPGILDTPAMAPIPNQYFQEFGALPVSPKNFYGLMQTGQTALLFPGGAKEALSGRKDYPLFWSDKVDFVRVAARFNATILPLSAIGMIDSATSIVEPEDLIKLPFVGERLRNLSSNITAARFDAKDSEEIMLPALALPSTPQRNYFLFGKPFDTTTLDPNDKNACEKAYRQVRGEVRNGIDDLMHARKSDPFANTPQRLMYEQVFGKSAPTFPVDLLN